MRGALRIAKIFGIPVQVHWSFALLFLFVIYVGKSRDASWFNIGIFGLVILVLFICVLLHELGHALSARYFGINTHDIIILPIGGVARLDKLPEKPFQEFIVAIAGPAVNLVIYSILALFLYVKYALQFSINELLSNEDLIGNPVIGFLITIMKTNFMLVVFNMIPAFPMDGGRVFRALLSLPFSRIKATKVAAFFGQFIAVGLFIYALLPAVVFFLSKKDIYAPWFQLVNWYFQPVLALISCFVFYFARMEYKDVKLEGQLHKLSDFKVSQIIRTTFTPYQTSEPIHSAIQEWTKGQETNFLVFDSNNILRGVLQEADIMDAMKHRHYDAMISTYSTFNFENTTLDATLKDVYEKMSRTGQYILPVLKNTKNIQLNGSEELGNQHEVLGVVDLPALEKMMKNGNYTEGGKES